MNPNPISLVDKPPPLAVLRCMENWGHRHSGSLDDLPLLLVPSTLPVKVISRVGTTEEHVWMKTVLQPPQWKGIMVSLNVWCFDVRCLSTLYIFIYTCPQPNFYDIRLRNTAARNPTAVLLTCKGIRQFLPMGRQINKNAPNFILPFDVLTNYSRRSVTNITVECINVLDITKTRKCAF